METRRDHASGSGVPAVPPWLVVAILGLACSSGAAVEGRFVRIELPQRATPVREGRILSVAEIQVYRGEENVALDGTATQSKGRTPAKVAIDGVMDDPQNTTHSEVGAFNPWLEVDLGKPTRIDALVVWNRPALPERLHGFLLSVLDAQRRVAWYQRFPEARHGAMRIVPIAFAGACVGVRIEPGAGAWYDVAKETPAARGSFATPTLLPTGQLDRLPAQALDPSRSPLVEVQLGQPADAAERRARFRRRNSDDETRTLCLRLRSVLKPHVRGLEDFRRLCERGEHRRALEAYRAYFFSKLKSPEAFGARTENIFFEQVRSRGKGALLKVPSPFALKNMMKGRAVHLYRNEILVGDIGPPGTVNWAPPELKPPAGATYARGPDGHPFWSTDDGKSLIRRIELCRAMSQIPSMYHGLEGFRALLYSYAATGDRSCLQRWLDYADDWCLHARRDIDACPSDVRRATELETQALRTFLNLLRVLLDERPQLARDFDAATLARYLTTLVKELPPYTIRAKRTEIANWGIMGICHLLHAASFLNEFKAMDFFRRETWRLWMANFIQHRTLDGENAEAWDLGHNGVDIEYALASVPHCALPPEADALAQREFWDLVRVNQRNLLTHISPNGKYWPRWFPDGGFRSNWRGVPDLTHNALRLKYLALDPRERYHLDLVADEPGARSRIETLLTGGEPNRAKLPDRFSDIAPYAAMYYLRESWEPGAEYLLMQNFRRRSQDTAIRDVPQKNRFGGSARTMYEISKGGRVLLAASPIAVDRKPDNRWHEAIPTGGKTNVLAPMSRHVVDTRFQTSTRFDLAEARQDAPYCRPAVQVRGDWYGLYTPVPGKDNTPVTDVTAWRQVFRIRGEDITIVSDRIENRGSTPHEYAQFFTLPACIPEKGFAERVVALAEAGHRLIEVDAEAALVRTANVGFDNVTVRLFGPRLAFASRIDRRLEHETIAKSQLQIIQDALARKRPVREVVQRHSKRPVSARWTAAGNQVLVTVIATRPAVAGTEAPSDSGVAECRPLPGKAGVTGFRAVARGGTRVWYQAGPRRRNRLVAGPVAAEAECLLAVERNGELSGIALSCAALTVRGKAVAAGTASFEYSLTKDGAFNTEPIHTPIDTVRIRPAANVFTESVEVSFDIPTQDARDIDFRYTLDGAEPTLESPLYTGPFTLRETAMVKVRPFRKGLKATPWHFTGTDCGKMIATIFRKEPRRRARPAKAARPGLEVEYMEGDWPSLFTYAGVDGVLEVTARGHASGLLRPAEVAAFRKTDGAYALRYTGILRVPTTGVYAFHAPEHLYTTTMDAGYDLRLWVDGEEWFPAPRLHSEHTWFIPLDEGAHGFRVSFADYRTRPFHNEYWMAWRPKEMWQGMPALEVSGPGVTRQPVPTDWLWRK